MTPWLRRVFVAVVVVNTGAVVAIAASHEPLSVLSAVVTVAGGTLLWLDGRRPR